MSDRQVRQPDVLLQRDRRRSTGDVTHLDSTNVHRIVIASDISSEHHETGKLALNSLGLLFCEYLASHEIALAEIDDPSQPCLQQRRTSVEIIAIEKQSC